MNEPKKKRFKVHAVVAAKAGSKPDAKRYAQEMEDALNALYDEGYTPQITGDALCDSTVIGVNNSMDEPHPLVALLSRRHAHEHQELAPKSEKTELALERMDKAMENGGLSMKKFETIVDDEARSLMKNISAHEVPVVAEDLEALAKDHEKGHTGAPTDCEVPEILRLFAKKLKEHAQQNIQ